MFETFILGRAIPFVASFLTLLLLTTILAHETIDQLQRFLSRLKRFAQFLHYFASPDAAESGGHLTSTTLKDSSVAAVARRRAGFVTGKIAVSDGETSYRCKVERGDEAIQQPRVMANAATAKEQSRVTGEEFVEAQCAQEDTSLPAGKSRNAAK